MRRKMNFLIGGFIFLIAIIVSSFLAQIVGRQLEKFSTRIYQHIIGKQSEQTKYDSTGVPYVVYEGNIGRQYNAVSVSESVLNMTNKQDSLINGNFFNCIGWLINNAQILNDSSIIFFDNYNWPSYNMTSPWRSAMNQGRAMQAFLMAYKKTNDSIYLSYATKSMNTLFTEVKHGGVTYIDSLGYWYEEYADDNAPQSRVLNGMIVVLQALSDFYKITNDSNAYFLFFKGVESVKSTIQLYDNKGHSNYDALGKSASPWYHKFHIEQLGFLIEETHDPLFCFYRQKWVNYQEPSYLASLYCKPTNIGMFTVFSIFAFVLSILFLLFYFLWFRRSKIVGLKS